MTDVVDLNCWVIRTCELCNKKMYVSPFIKIKTKYHFYLSKPDKQIEIFIKQTDIDGILLSACQVGRKQNISTNQLLINFFKHPMMTIKIIMAIHFEALRLWRKGVKLVKRKVKIKNNLSLEK